MKHPFTDPDVEVTFNGFDENALSGLLSLRDLIFDTALSDPRIGAIQEALRWGQPAYLTPATKSGSTVRLGVSTSGKIALFLHCRTTLVSGFVAAFPGQDIVEGNRAILFESPAAIDSERHGWLIHQALTYHL